MKPNVNSLLTHILKRSKFINFFLVLRNLLEFGIRLDLESDDENIFYGTKPDSLIPGIYDKTLECFEHIESSYHYKYILRANVSSFFIIDQLLKCSQSLPESNVYAGVIGKNLRISFCSGSGYWMSPDIVKQLIDLRTSRKKTQKQLANELNLPPKIILETFFANPDELSPSTIIPDKVPSPSAGK